MAASRLKAAIEMRKELRKTALVRLHELEMEIIQEKKLLADLDLDLESATQQTAAQWAKQNKGRSYVGGGDPFQKLADFLNLPNVTEEVVKEARSVCLVSEVMES